MVIRKVTALFLPVLILFAGVILVGGPLVTGAEAATNQPEMEVESVALSDSEIETGETVEVTAVVENDGDVEGDHTATLEVDGEQRSSQTVTVAPDEERTVSFEEQFDDPGAYEIAVNGEEEQELTVLEPGDLVIRDSDTYYTRMLTGQTLYYSILVRNVGGTNGPFTVELTANGRTVSDEELSVRPGERTSLRLAFVPDRAGTYDMQIETGDAVDEGGFVEVLGPPEPEFEVTDASVRDDRIEAGERALVTADVENVGTAAGTYETELFVDGTVVDSTQARLDSGESTTVEFRHPFSDPGEYDVRVDDVAAGSVTVLRPAQFELSDASVSANRVLTGDSVRVTASVANTGDVAGSFTARLKIDGDEAASTPYRVDGGESRFVTFDHRFDTPGEHTVAINDERAGTVTVLRPADLSVTEARTNRARVQTGETVRIAAAVENAGEITGERTVNLEIDGRVVESTDVDVPGGESTVVEFTRQFETRGERRVTVNGVSADTVAVLAPATIDVTGAETGRDEVLTGESFPVQASVENTGDLPGETTVDLAVDGSVVESTELTVDGQETETVEFTQSFAEPGERTLRVNGESAGQVSVRAPARFETTDPAVSNETVLTTDTVSITADVRNTGDVEGTYDAVLGVDGQQVQSTTVTLGGGESTTVSFDHQIESAGEYTLRVGDATAGTVTALLPADLSVVSADTARTEISTDQRLSVGATVENSGNVSGETTVELEVNGSSVDQNTVALDGGERTTIDFAYQFDSTGGKRVAVNGMLASEVVALAPAEFDISDARLAPQSLLAGESTTISADVENLGEVPGVFDARLFVQGEAVSTNRVELGPGESQQVTFRQSFTELGTYAVAISGTRAGEVVVEQPPTLNVMWTTVNETTILENDSVRIDTQISNTGDRPGTFTVDLLIDGAVVAQRTASTPAGNTTSVSFDHQFPDSGEYELRVEDAAVGTITVDQPAALELIDTALNRSSVLAGDPVEVIATVANDGDRSGTYEIAVAVEGETVNTRSVTVSGQNTQTVRFSRTFETPGEYSIELNDQTAGTVDVNEQPDIEVDRAAVPADWVAEGEATTVRTVVENPGEWTTTRTVTVTVDEDEVAAKSVTLEPGEQRQVEIEFEANNGTVEVNGVEAGTIESSESFEEDKAGGQTQTDGIDFYPILTLVLVLGVVVVGWFALSLTGVFNWRD